MKAIKLLPIFLLLLVAEFTFAQPGEQFYYVSVATDHADWNYKIGEKVKFMISVTQHNNDLKDAKITIQIGPEMMPAVINETKVINETITVDGGTMKTPGFLRCIVTTEVGGKKYRGLATAAFEAEKIKPTTTTPSDFEAFWTNAIAQNSKIPLDPKLTLLPERCTEKTNVYQLSIQNFRNNGRFYGILCVPKKQVNIQQC